MTGISGYGPEQTLSPLDIGQLFTTVSASAAGTTQVVAAISERIIRVVAVHAIATSNVGVNWVSNTTIVTGTASFAANGGYVLPFNNVGWFQTHRGEALHINLSSAVAVGGSLVYVVF